MNAQQKLDNLKLSVIDVIEDCLINFDTDKYTREQKGLALAHGELYKQEFSKLLNKYMPECCPSPTPESIMPFTLVLKLKGLKNIYEQNK